MTAAVVAPVAMFTALAVVVVVTALRSKRWAVQADRLARQSDIELPPAVVGRVARRMRTEYLLSTALVIPALVGYQAVFERLLDFEHPHQRAVAYSVTVTSLPFVVIVFSAVLAIPGWNTARELRVTHLVRPSLDQLFTRGEWWVTALGVAVGIGAGVWGFWRVGAGLWWIAWPPMLLLAAAAWWCAVRAIVARRTRASDNVELGWDDVLRYRQARGLTVGAAWPPAAFLCLVDFEFGDSGGLSLIPFYVVVGVVVALMQIYKQGRGNWRRSWNADQA